MFFSGTSVRPDPSVKPGPCLRLGDLVPDFSADSSLGRIESFHEYLGGRWGMLFSHPADFTPVCSTEVASIAKHAKEFEKRGVREKQIRKVFISNIYYCLWGNR